MKQIKLKIKKISAFGNSCNFCVTPNGLTNNVNEIEGHHLIVRMCDDCLKELLQQKELLLADQDGNSDV